MTEDGDQILFAEVVIHIFVNVIHVRVNVVPGYLMRSFREVVGSTNT